jgi:hypothetical protein
MARWRLFTLILIILAVALWAVLLSLNLRPELAREFPHEVLPSPGLLRLEQLPAWVASLELFSTLLLAGVANLYLFPARIRNMGRALGLGWTKLIQILLVGLGIGFLLFVFAVGAVMARITFPFTILAALVLFFLSVWGFATAAYVLGRYLMRKAGWGHFSPVIDVALGLLLLLPLMRIPFAGGIVMIVYVGLGLGLVIVTRFGSDESWSLISLLEEENE